MLKPIVQPRMAPGSDESASVSTTYAFALDANFTIRCECIDQAFVPWDIEIARINFGANCGPASFAAITGKEVCRVMGHFHHFEHSRWTNLTQMLRAFAATDYGTKVHKCVLPARGVALVQWLGPWTE